MIASASEARVGVSPDPSRVIVTLATSVSAAQVWQALTETSSVAMWFGSLTAELRPGSPARLDFGDGDFFTLDDIQLNPPYGLQYTWRFFRDWTERRDYVAYHTSRRWLSSNCV